ncbi:unnamed protein product [marine sediment metagenome]|uniref:DUF86 domain-containing protein n=2 Tax=marine sediment metagenome TaxID=412755 RepID=X1R065_9ZZZZ
MKRDMRLYVQDILESIEAIEEYMQTLTEEEFYENRQVQDAVLRRFEIIGEAAKKMDEDFRGKYADIPWKKIAGMRDVLIHEYFGVNLKRVWLIIKRDLPELELNFLRIWEEIKD